jgi:hypothetical protein
MCWWRRKSRGANIPADVRRELESYGVTAVQVALTHPFDVPTSPMFSLRHEHREHVLAWLAEKREAAERRETRRFLWTLLLTVAATLAGILAAFAAWIGAWSEIKTLFRTWFTY